MTDTAILNGAAHHQTNGRAVPDYPSFTFASSGRTVQVRKLSPMTMQRIAQQTQKDMPPPAAPVYEVEIDGGVKTTETNEADPVYQQALRAYNEQVKYETGMRFMRLCASYVLASDVPVDEVAEYRAAMDAAGAPLGDEDDRWVYLWEMCAASERDMQDFQQYVLGRAQATPEAVQAHVDSFRGDV
jgi:hypothetical protein